MIRRMIGKRLRIWGVSFPAWVLGVAIFVVAAAAGQAVGPVLSGGVQGSAGLVVEQSVVLNEGSGFSLGTGAGNDGVFATNDEGTAFTAAFELHVGDTIVIGLELGNVSDALANAMLSLNVPKGIDVEVGSDPNDDEIKEAQLSAKQWLLSVESDAGDSEPDSLNITVSPKDDLMPGFYTITGRIVQVAN